ncbi:hypothetical protein SAMN05216359_105171 [Roseateles sp. YR242]|uniref:hypothetical protein n=1 Tax=Roseateles sp. YR242 TaxID=1855305 RepID=UPI0008D082F3|nr:hypothetical protein [Roseateles sp. YR242]SEL09770.1 hypothetical protein SAMN05216359_105171 [Roseateles sp. YR242]
MKQLVSSQTFPVSLTSVARLLAALCVAISASGCLMYSSDYPASYVSKMELRLNTGAIKDPVVRQRAEEAQADILRTMRVLVDSRLDRQEAEQKLNWASSAPLLLPPEMRGAAMAKIDPLAKRRPMPFMAAESWSSPDASNVILVAMFSDAAKPEREVRERQTYRRAQGRWALVEQVRIH